MAIKNSIKTNDLNNIQKLLEEKEKVYLLQKNENKISKGVGKEKNTFINFKLEAKTHEVKLEGEFEEKYNEIKSIMIYHLVTNFSQSNDVSISVNHEKTVTRKIICKLTEIEVDELIEKLIFKSSTKTDEYDEKKLQNIIILGAQDFLKNRQIKKVSNFFENYETIFEDFEAARICYGLYKPNSARNFAVKFFANKIDSKGIKFLHDVSMETILKYESHLISQILEMPNLPFKAFDANQLFSEMDRRISEKPVVRLGFYDSENNFIKIKISFLIKENKDYAVIRKNGNEVGLISRDGYFITDNKIKDLEPILRIFILFNKDSKKELLYYGLQTVECGICGRKLTDYDSIRFGIGPICRSEGSWL